MRLTKAIKTLFICASVFGLVQRKSERELRKRARDVSYTSLRFYFGRKE